MSRNTQWKVAGFGVSALVLVAALVLANGTPKVHEPLSLEASDRDEYAQQALAALRAADPTGELRYDPEQFLIQQDRKSVV